jgi:hypothetical protein
MRIVRDNPEYYRHIIIDEAVDFIHSMKWKDFKAFRKSDDYFDHEKFNWVRNTGWSFFVNSAVFSSRKELVGMLCNPKLMSFDVIEFWDFIVNSYMGCSQTQDAVDKMDLYLSLANLGDDIALEREYSSIIHNDPNIKWTKFYDLMYVSNKLCSIFETPKNIQIAITLALKELIIFQYKDYDLKHVKLFSDFYKAMENDEICRPSRSHDGMDFWNVEDFISDVDDEVCNCEACTAQQLNQ